MMAALLLLLCATARAEQILWQDPGPIANWDFGRDVGTGIRLPQPPYTFLKEDLSGTQPKIFVRDGAGITWNVKFGYESKVESFCWRVVRACGYFWEASYLVPEGVVLGLQPLQRGGSWIRPDGHFTNGRFQYRDPEMKFLSDRNWRWDGPPFAGTKELSGLKVLIMLFSNWDNKDGRAGGGASSGPNTAIFQKGRKYIYAFTDWGSGMGRWSGARTDWRCSDFAEQTPEFVIGIRNGMIQFGFQGDIRKGFDDNIPPAHVAWLMRYLGKITDAQLNAGLKASGATDAEADCFTKALRGRIEQLGRAGARNSASRSWSISGAVPRFPSYADFSYSGLVERATAWY